MPDSVSAGALSAIRDRVARIAESPFIVALFGSRSRGTHNPDSDVDIFIDFAGGYPANGHQVLEAAHAAALDAGIEVFLDVYVVGQWNTPTAFYGLNPAGSMSLVILDKGRRECLDDCPVYCGDCHVCGNHRQTVLIDASGHECFQVCRPCFGRWDGVAIPERSVEAGEFVRALRAVEPKIEGMADWPVRGRMRFPVEYTKPAREGVDSDEPSVRL